MKSRLTWFVILAMITGPLFGLLLHEVLGSGPAAESAAAADSPRPGLNSCTATRPMVMETSVASTNQPSAFAPILAIAAAPYMRATPTTSVENTNGAMIILMRRKKLEVTREKAAAALSAAGPVPSI